MAIDLAAAIAEEMILSEARASTALDNQTNYMHTTACPRLSEQPTANLARGNCCRCGALLDGPASARVLTARRLTKETDHA